MLQNVQKAGQALGDLNKLRQQQQKMQTLLQSIKVVGKSKNGKVSVTMSGEQKIIEISIDPELISFVHSNFLQAGDDALKARGSDFIGRSIIEAVNDAISQVQAEVVKKMQEGNAMGDLVGMIEAANTLGKQ